MPKLFRLFAIALLILSVCSINLAYADSTLARIRARGELHCGSVERPGLAFETAEGRWIGLSVDICRAIATAVLGSPELIQYHDYVSPTDFARVRQQQDDVFFLTGGEISAQNLSGQILPGPAIFMASHAVMVPGNAPERHLSDLSGAGICYLIADPTERSLNAYFDTTQKSWFHHAYSEVGEMNDAYGVQRCHALAGETTQLAVARLTGSIAPLSSRILPEPLNVFPVIAATGTADAQWAAIVAWAVNTLMVAEQPEGKWTAGGVHAMPVDAAELGLSKDWQTRMLQATGNYGDMFARNLGSKTALKLERGLNASPLQGGLLVGPYSE